VVVKKAGNRITRTGQEEDKLFPRLPESRKKRSTRFPFRGGKTVNRGKGEINQDVKGKASGRKRPLKKKNNNTRRKIIWDEG